MKYAILLLVLATVLFAQSAFQITTPATLPPATTGTPYLVILQTSGGQAPYLWFQGTPGLPSGLWINANGTIGGTPTKPGTYTIAVGVLDSSGSPLDGGLITGAAEADQQFVLIVN